MSKMKVKDVRKWLDDKVKSIPKNDKNPEKVRYRERLMKYRDQSLRDRSDDEEAFLPDIEEPQESQNNPS